MLAVYIQYQYIYTKFKIPSGELANADGLRDHLLDRLASLVVGDDADRIKHIFIFFNMTILPAMRK